jgi:hypothetical protein
MNALDDNFELLKKEIEPSAERVGIAKTLPGRLRDYLKSTNEINTIDPHSRLSGSYARKTAIHDIKDVDILLLVHNDYFYESPASVLNSLADVLREWPTVWSEVGVVDAAVVYQRRSIKVELPTLAFRMDIVPVVAMDGLEKPLYIPDKSLKEWVKTHPLGYGEALSRLNQTNSEKVVPLIKMIKHWRDVQMTYMRPKSYWLEATIYHLINNGTLSTDNKGDAVLFRDTISAISNRFSDALAGDSVPRVLDPMLGHNITKNWDRSAFETFMNRIEETKKRANKALEDDTREEEAIELWQKIFNADGNEWFSTTTLEDKFKNFKSAALSGSVLVEKGTGKVQTTKQTSNSIPSPFHRNYGMPHEGD